MYLQQLSLLQFKNYEEAKFDFCEGINCLVGENGCGKTNLLDAIHYLSMTRSAFNPIEQQNVKHGQDHYMILGMFEKNNSKYKVNCGYFQQKKSFRVNKVEYDRLSEHIGVFPSVLIAPNDTDLVREGSEVRRKFFDSMISQTDRGYMQQLIQYNHVLKQRNSLLRMYEGRRVDPIVLQVYDGQLLKLAKSIHQKRSEFCAHFFELFIGNYNQLSNQKEAVQIQYRSEVGEEDYEERFTEAFEKDRVLLRTTKGIHRDDYVFKIDNYALKKYGSQGQQKSFVISLKLAQFDIVYRYTSSKPLLLLDDIFDKLDDFRIKQLLEMVATNKFGQIFITDARPERSRKLLEDVESEVQFTDVSRFRPMRKED
ncbi:DNA replication/repair protein RecF [Sediminitomix flava]|uniref:DNA replication and repair protein RecF n=1 Tax=Sediminitomix flava TaxID=379075 RepID=A0A315Z2V3_SEDFL|nr:DNA replication and repair protein RecF [Sediminitomix flava]PWJ36126.1 DNA replication and repair protein RecF [Sediminitomix flava]